MNTNQKFLEEYSAALSQQKRIIRTNPYARELEERYHKNSHKPLKKLITLASNVEESCYWPIESPVFTEVLRMKLKNLTTKGAPSPNPATKALTDIKRAYQFRFQSDDHFLPRLDRSKFWSPPKALTRISKYKLKEPKEFGPKVKQIHCVHKSSLLA